jgi:hypothetical protein
MSGTFNPKNATELERRAICLLAETFRSAPREISHSAFREGLQIDSEFPGLITRLHHFGAIQSSMLGKIVPSPAAVDMASEIERFKTSANEPPDLIDSIKKTVHRHPIFARVLIAFIVLSALAPFVNQLLELFIKFGWMKPPKP